MADQIGGFSWIEAVDLQRYDHEEPIMIRARQFRDLRGTKKLVHDDNEAVQRSLFDSVPDDMND